jgi:hypothetical protein
MKNKYTFLTAIAFSALILLTGCNNNREKKVEDAKDNVKQANEELKAAQTEYDNEWQIFKDDAELKISSNEKNIEILKEKIDKSNKKFKTKYEKKVSELEQKNIELKKKISEYKYDGKDKWEDFKKGFSKDISIIDKAVKDILAKKD